MEKEVVFGHSPDSDDAFMYYGIASGNVKLDNYKISHLYDFRKCSESSNWKKI